MEDKNWLLKMKRIAELVSKIPVLERNQNYRFGDLILQKGARWRRDRKTILREERFNGSLLKNYLENLQDPFEGRFDRRLLSEQCEKMLKSNKMETLTDELAINIRTGDVVQRPLWYAKYDKIDAVERDLSGRFIFNHPLLIERISEMLTSNKRINALTIVGTMHFGHNEVHQDWLYTDGDVELNRQLLGILLQKVKKSFPALRLRLNENNQGVLLRQDFDFLYLVSTPNAILEDQASGFAKLISEVRSARTVEP